MPDEKASVSDQVAVILQAAEDTAQQIRDEAEARLKSRIAEADRAAENRVKAAEDEAAEIINAAHTEAQSIRRDAVARANAEADRIRMEADEAKDTATGEALAIIARAQETADDTLRDANVRVREMLSDARSVAGDLRVDSDQLAGHIHELGESLRANAARLIRDIQAVHSTFLAQIDKVDPERTALHGPAGVRNGSAGGPHRSGVVDDLDVPEFLPRP